jgi:hypothetical protein
LDKLNLTIDMFETSYKPILNRIEESDDAQINFVKYNLEKLNRYIEQLGKEFKYRSDDIMQNLNMISSETDITIFIDSNKSSNQFLIKEQFLPYDSQKSSESPSSKPKIKKTVSSEQNNTPFKRDSQTSL